LDPLISTSAGPNGRAV